MIKKVITLFFLSFSYLGIAQGTYTLSSDSKLTVDGTSTIHDWTVAANSLAGSITMKDGLPKAIEFKVEVAGIQSERGATMDKKMHAALKKEEHPEITFVLAEIKNSTSLIGTLNIAGYEKTVEIPVKMNTDNTSLKISGQYTITLQEYGIEPPTAMFNQIIVGDVVTVKFDMVFLKIDID